MPSPNNNTLVKPQSAQSKGRSALGIGVTTLVTIMVVLLLAAFAVLSLASARSDLELSNMAAQSAQDYYTADSEATAWYAQLDGFVATLNNTADDFLDQLSAAGYDASYTEAGQLHISRGFKISDYRTLMVTIAINDDKTTTIRQWQS